MIKTLFAVLVGIGIGVAAGYFLFFQTDLQKESLSKVFQPKKEVVGFLPYWLLDRAQKNYGDSLTTLSYFGLTIGPDGKIVKLANPQEEEPGWYALESGKLQPFFDSAKKNNIALSLTLFSGTQDAILALTTDPVQHAKNLVEDVSPILTKYDFSNVNLDVEYTKEASPEAQLHFSKFLQTLKSTLAEKNNHITLTIDVTTNDPIQPDLIDTHVAGEVANYVLLMAYDYHFAGSFVSGPVAPLTGAGISSEYDVVSATQKLQQKVPSEKILLGIPTYGYEWETLDQFSRAATIPGTGLAASNKRAEDLLASCATCSATTDTDANEMKILYFDPTTTSYHQIFYPTKDSTTAKVHLVDTMHLGGIGVWALGYEGKTIMDPLQAYKKIW